MTLSELLHEPLLALHHDCSFSFSWSLPGCLQDRLHCNTCLQYSKRPRFSGSMLLELWSSTPQYIIKAQFSLLEPCFLTPSHAEL